MAIITRADKGSALTYNEMDANFEAIAPRDSATGSVQIPSGTTSERTATPQIGQLRFNTTANAFEGYIAGNWQSLIAGNSGEINQNAFSEFIVSGQNNVAADNKTDSLTLVAGTNISITTDAVNDSITFTNTFTQDFAFASLTGTPTTIAGYGITDAFDGAYSSLTGAPTNVSAFTNDSGYLTSFTETNDLSSAVTWANVPDANITESSVTQHQAALSITESQISDLGAYLTTETNDLSSTVTWANVPNANITESSVTQHQAALSITESQISDFGTYLTSETTTTLISDSVNQRLRYTDETGTVNNINLSWAVDDTNLARITSGSVAADTGIATFTRDDASSFTVDFSALFDDTNLARITAASFNTGNGVLTLTRGGDATTVTVDLDGRYLTGYTETDPVVGAINGLVKSDGSGNISAAVAGTDYSTFNGTFGALTGTPTTIAGYGITDAFDGAYSSLTGTPTFITALQDDTTPTLGGDLTVNNADILIGDYDYIYFGDDSDLQIGHESNFGGNNFIRSLNETLSIQAQDLYIENASSQEIIRTNSTGQAIISYAGSWRLRTVADGTDVDADLNIGGNVDANFSDTSSINMGAGGLVDILGTDTQCPDLEIQHLNSSGYIRSWHGDLVLWAAGTGASHDVRILGSRSDNSYGGTPYFEADGSTGEAKLFHYGTQRVTTKSTGVELKNTTGATGVTTVTDGTNTIQLNTDISGTQQITSTGEMHINFGSSGWTVKSSGTELIFSYGGSNKMKIDSSGNLTVTGNVTGYGTV